MAAGDEHNHFDSLLHTPQMEDEDKSESADDRNFPESANQGVNCVIGTETVGDDSPMDPTLPLSDHSVLPPPNPLVAFEVVPGDESRHVVSPRLGAGYDDNSKNTLDGARSPNEVASDGGLPGLRGGFTLRTYEEELNNLRRDNFSLRFRIYLMEERYDLLKHPNDPKENVYKINLDLRVENESMKKALEEKTKLLQAAYEEIENQERERLRERQDLESQLESLRNTIAESKLSHDQFSSMGMTMSPKESLKEEDNKILRCEEVLRNQLPSSKLKEQKVGADRALSVAAKVYQSAVNEYTSSCQDTVAAMHQRLGELVDFLQQLLSMESDGLLDFSTMSHSMRAALHKSLEESRRLSQSLSSSRLNDDLNETQSTSVIGDFELPRFVLPEVVVEFDDAVDEDKETSALEEAVRLERDELRRQVALDKELRLAAEKEAMDMKEKVQELTESVALMTEEKNVANELRKDLDRVRSQAEKSRREVESLRSKLDEATRTRQDLLEAGKEVEGLRGRLEEMAQKLQQADKAQAEVGVLKATLEELTNERERWRHETEDFKKVVGDAALANKENETYKQEVLQLKKEIKTLTEKDEYAKFSKPLRSFDEHEFAIDRRRHLLEINESRKAPGASQKTIASPCCDCRCRLAELERLLQETKNMYEEAQEKIRIDKERKEKIERMASEELSKTKRLLKKLH